MIQLKSRVNSLTFGDTEREVINQRLIEYQEKKGIVFSSIKEMFSTLLNDALNSENIEIKEVEKPIPDGLHLISTENKLTFEDMLEAIDKYTEGKEFPSEMTKLDILNSVLLKAESIPETITVEKEVVKTVERQLEPNEILLSLKDEPKRPLTQKLELLSVIQERRQIKFKLPEKETLSEIIEGMVFTDGVIFNINGDYFTGF